MNKGMMLFIILFSLVACMSDGAMFQSLAEKLKANDATGVLLTTTHIKYNSSHLKKFDSEDYNVMQHLNDTIVFVVKSPNDSLNLRLMDNDIYLDNWKGHIDGCNNRCRAIT